MEYKTKALSQTIFISGFLPCTLPKVLLFLMSLSRSPHHGPKSLQTVITRRQCGQKLKPTGLDGNSEDRQIYPRIRSA